MDVDQPRSTAGSRRSRNRNTRTRLPADNNGGTRPARPVRQRTAKVQIERLPPDVEEKDLQDYFYKVDPAPSRIELLPGNRCEITFRSTADAEEMLRQYSGASIRYNGRQWALTMYLLKSAADLDDSRPRDLGSRFSVPNKAEPRSSNGIVKANQKGGKNKTSKPMSAAGGEKKGQRQRRQKPTAEQLDQEMADYFKAPGDQTMQ